MATFEDVIIRVTERGAKETANAIGLVGKESEKTAGAVASLNRIMYTLGAAFSVKSLVEYIDKWQGMSNQIRIVTKDSAELTKQQERLFKVAQNARVSISSLTDLYASLSLSQKETGVSGEKLHKVIETISKTLTLSGASGQASAAGLRQLVQGLQSGKLNGEELRSVLENTRYTALTLAKGLGVPVGALRQMGADGELTAEKVIAAFLKMSESVDKDFGKTSVTISQALTVLDNAFTRFIGTTGEASGIAGVLSSGLVLLANNIDVVIGGLALLTGAWITYRVAVTAVAVAQAAANLAISASPVGRIAMIIAGAITLLTAYVARTDKATDTTKKLGNESNSTFKTIADGISSVVGWFASVNKAGDDAMTSIKTSWLEGWKSIDDYIESWDDWFRSKTESWPTAVNSALNTIQSYFSSAWESIKSTVGNVIDWMTTKLQAFLDWFKGAVDALIAAAKAFNAGSGNTSADPPKVAGARAAGGPVKKGQTYLVGEEGPELWTAHSSGTIIPNGGSGGSPFGPSGVNTSPQRVVELLAEGVAAATNDNLVRIADASEKTTKLLEIASTRMSSSSTSSSGSLASSVIAGGNGLSAINNFGDITGAASAANTPTNMGASLTGSVNPSAVATKNAADPANHIWGWAKIAANKWNSMLEQTRMGKRGAIWPTPESAMAAANVPQQIREQVALLLHKAGARDIISSAKVEPFRSGGTFTVPGGTGVDSKIIPIRASPGERVSVETHKQQRENDASSNSSGRPIEINFHIQTPDADSFRKSEKQISRDLIMTLQKAVS